MGISHAQAVEVAKRLDPRAGRPLWFSEDGSLLSTAEAQRGVADQSGEVYVCRRAKQRAPVEVARVSLEELESGAEPAYGTAW